MSNQYLLQGCVFKRVSPGLGAPLKGHVTGAHAHSTRVSMPVAVHEYESPSWLKEVLGHPSALRGVIRGWQAGNISHNFLHASSAAEYCFLTAVSHVAWAAILQAVDPALFCAALFNVTRSVPIQGRSSAQIVIFNSAGHCGNITF